MKQTQTSCALGLKASLQTILDRYNPKRDNSFTLAEAVSDKHPVLAEIRSVYGQERAWACVYPHIMSLNEFSKKTKMDDYQKQELARLFAKRFYYFNLAEVNLFFEKVKSGEYGTFYGVIDPMDIMEKAKTFEQERNREIDRQENIKHLAELERNRQNAVSYDVYLANK